MVIITEDYVSFETAKLLKEKGFDEPCRTYYQDKEFVDDVCTQYYQWNSKSLFGQISAPTLQMTCKWLREKHHLHVIPDISDTSKLEPNYYCVIWNTSNQQSYIIDLFNSYEQACEEAAKYCLENLI